MVMLVMQAHAQSLDADSLEAVAVSLPPLTCHYPSSARRYQESPVTQCQYAVANPTIAVAPSRVFGARQPSA